MGRSGNIFVTDLWHVLYKDAVAHNNWKEALRYYQKETELLRITAQKQTKAKIYEITEGFNLKEKESAIRDLKRENQYSQSRLYYSIAIGSLLLLLITALLWISKRNRKIKEIAYSNQIKELEYILLEQESSLQEARNKSAMEKKAIGRNLHDGLSGSIAILAYSIDDYKAVAATGPEKEKWLEIQQELSALYKEARDYSHRLSNEEITKEESINLAAYVSGLKDRFKHVGAINIHETYNEINWAAIGQEKSESIFWILKECFTNTVKHAKAKNIWVEFNQDKNTLNLLFKDDGIGMKENAGSHSIGFKNIRNYVTQLKGDWLRNSDTRGIDYKFVFPDIVDT